MRRSALVQQLSVRKDVRSKLRCLIKDEIIIIIIWSKSIIITYYYFSGTACTIVVSKQSTFTLIQLFNSIFSICIIFPKNRYHLLFCKVYSTTKPVQIIVIRVMTSHMQPITAF